MEAEPESVPDGDEELVVEDDSEPDEVAVRRYDERLRSISSAVRLHLQTVLPADPQVSL